jgi:hypothetical protein
VLTTIKVAHTIAWAIFVGCILAIPVASLRDDHQLAASFAAVVAAEVCVLIITDWRCPLTYLAARYTRDRRDNFDIFLPEWLAKYNKHVFGTLYCAGLVFALARWASSP